MERTRVGIPGSTDLEVLDQIETMAVPEHEIDDHQVGGVGPDGFEGGGAGGGFAANGEAGHRYRSGGQPATQHGMIVDDQNAPALVGVAGCLRWGHGHGRGPRWRRVMRAGERHRGPGCRPGGRLHLQGPTDHPRPVGHGVQADAFALAGFYAQADPCVPHAEQTLTILAAEGDFDLIGPSVGHGVVDGFLGNATGGPRPRGGAGCPGDRRSGCRRCETGAGNCRPGSRAPLRDRPRSSPAGRGRAPGHGPG